jgi:hypothetical protein
MLRVAVVWYVTIHVSRVDVLIDSYITSLSVYKQKHGRRYMEETAQ